MLRIQTGESQWERPDELAWERRESEAGVFYWNTNTQESTWDEPKHVAWEIQDSEL